MNAPAQPPGSVNRSVHVLALNSGSSSLKFGLYRVDASIAEPLMTGEAEALGESTSTFHAQVAVGGPVVHEHAPLPGPSEAIARLLVLLRDTKLPVPQIIGHRLVHGGPTLTEHCRIDAAVLAQLEAAVPFAPLHLPAALQVIRLVQAQFSGVPQAACFDTSFHAHLPPVAQVLPLPRALRAQGIRRYGFHGLSCESIVRQLAPACPRRLLIAHLGNGASVTAVHEGRSVDTTMGLTPTGGLIMGTRSGDLDPGVLIYLARQQQLDPAALEDLVDRQSGLLGISGVSSDLRALHAAAASNEDARLALEMFCYSAAKHIAALSVVMNGAQLLVFTGGIGENDAEVRCTVRVLPSREDAEIARQSRNLCV